MSDKHNDQTGANPSGEETDEELVLRRLKDKQKAYKRHSIKWQTIHFVLGGMSVSLAAVISNDAVPAGWASIEGFAALVGILAALSTFLRPDARAKKFNAARHVLRRARTEYEHDNHPLVKALNEADDLVLHE